METTIKVTFEVITPGTFSNLTGVHPEGKGKAPYKVIETIEEAKLALKEFGSDASGEYTKYWKEQRDLCKIVKVTTITEEDINSTVQYCDASLILKALKNTIKGLSGFVSLINKKQKFTPHGVHVVAANEIIQKSQEVISKATA